MLRPFLALAALAWVTSPLQAAAPRAPTVAEITLLTESLHRTAYDMYRWACTQTMIRRDGKGRVKSEVVVRYDPSKPYPEQWTPLTVNGGPPRERDFRKYRRWGERQQRRDEDPESDNRPSLGEVMNLAAASIASESERHLVYEVPLRPYRNDRFPPEKFEVRVRVARHTGALENISVRLRDSFRMKLVVKVKSGEGELNFGTVDAARAPTLVDLKGDASASVLFMSVGGEYELRRTDFKYVTPYYERFQVQIGPMKAIDF